jgi:hypothetical protein
MNNLQRLTANSFPMASYDRKIERGRGAARVGQFDVEAALRRQLVRQPTDKLAATTSN